MLLLNACSRCVVSPESLEWQRRSREPTVVDTARCEGLETLAVGSKNALLVFFLRLQVLIQGLFTYPPSVAHHHGVQFTRFDHAPDRVIRDA